MPDFMDLTSELPRFGLIWILLTAFTGALMALLAPKVFNPMVHTLDLRPKGTDGTEIDSQQSKMFLEFLVA